MRKLTILLLLLTLCLSIAAFADSGQLGSGARTGDTPATDSRNPAFGSGAGIVADSPFMGSGGVSVTALRSTVIIQLARVFLAL